MSEWRKAVADGGRTYYYHQGTKETTWDKPDDFIESTASETPATPQHDQRAIDNAWDTAEGPDGRTYYWNKITQKTQYEVPPGFGTSQPPVRPAATYFRSWRPCQLWRRYVPPSRATERRSRPRWATQDGFRRKQKQRWRQNVA